MNTEKLLSLYANAGNPDLTAGVGDPKKVNNASNQLEALSRVANTPDNLLYKTPDQYIPSDYFDEELMQLYRPTDTNAERLNAQMAQRQSAWGEAGNALLRIIPNTTLEILSNIGSIADVEDWFGFDNETGNWLSNWARSTQQDVNRDLAPIYQSAPGKTLDVGNSEWWFNNGSNLVTSALGFVGTGYLTAGTGLAQLVGKNGVKAMQWMKSLNGGQVKNPFQMERNLTSLSNAFLLNQAESIAVATNVYDKVYKSKLEEYDKLMAEDKAPNIGRDDFAKQEASQAAAYSMNINRANILLNITSAGMFTNTIAGKPSRYPWMTGLNELKGNEFTRRLINLPSKSATIKRAGSESIQEYLEENINMIAENSSIARAENRDYSVSSDVFSREGFESGLLGAIGGAGQTMFTAMGRDVKRLGEKVDGVWKSKNEIQEEKYDAQRKAIEKLDKITESKDLPSFSTEFNSNFLQLDLIEQIKEAQENGEVDKAEGLKDKLLEVQAYKAFKNGITDSLINVYRSIQNMSDKEAKDRGFVMDDPKNNFRVKASLAIDKITQLEKEYYNSQQYENPDDVFFTKARGITIDNKLDYYNSDRTQLKVKTYQDLENAFQSGRLDREYLETTEGGDILRRPLFVNLDDLLYDKVKESDIQPGLNTDGKEKAKKIIDFLLENENYQELRQTESLYDMYQKLKVKNNEIYTDLTSKETQELIRKARAYKEKNTRTEKRKKKAKQDNAKGTKATKEAAANVKDKSTKIQDDEIDDTEESTNGEEDFSSTGNQSNQSSLNSNIPNDLNEVITLANQAIDAMETSDEKIQTLQSFIDEGDENDPAIINWAKTKLNEVQTNNQQQENKLDNDTTNSIKDLGDDLDLSINNVDDSNSILSEQQQNDLTTIERGKRAQRNMNVLLQAAVENGIGLDDFPSIAKFAAKVIGQEKFARIFSRFQNLYNSMSGLISKDTYQDIFFSESDKQVLNSVGQVLDSTNEEFIYTNDDSLFINNEHGNIIRKADKLVHAVDLGETNDIVFDYNKITNTASTAAYLSREYFKIVEVGDDGLLYLKREDAANELNQHMLDNTILDYRELKEKDEVTVEIDYEFNKEYNGKVHTYRTLKDRGKALSISQKKLSKDLFERLSKDTEFLLDLEPDLVPIIEKVIKEEKLSSGETRLMLDNIKLVQQIVSIEERKAQVLKEATLKYDNAFIPLVVKKNGKPIFHVHDYDWINDSTTAGDLDNILEQRKLLLNFRDKVAKNGSFKTYITYRGIGKLAKSKVKKPVSEVFPTGDIKYGIVKDGQVRLDGTNKTAGEILNADIHKTKLNEGYVYALVPTGFNKDGKTMYVPLPLEKRKLQDFEIDSIIEAIKSWYRGSEYLSYQMESQHKLDISNLSGLKSYLDLFVYSYNDYHTDKPLEQASEKFKSGVYLFNVNLNTGAIEFTRGAGVGYNFINKKTSPEIFDMNIKKLREHLQNMFVRFDTKLLGKEVTIPYITTQGDINAVTANYEDFIKKATLTNLLAFKMSNNNYTVMIQPIIQFSLDGNLPVEEKSPTIDPEEANTDNNPNTKIDNFDIDLDDFDVSMSINEVDQTQLRITLTEKFKNVIDNPQDFNLYLSALLQQNLSPLQIETEILKKYCK